MNSNTRLQIIIDPTAPKGELPFVRFAPGNGWSIQTATVKGCHLPDLAEAVADYNRAITRKIEGLNAVSVQPARFDVMDLPGWGDAVRDEMNARYTPGNHAEARHNARRGPGKTVGALGALLPMLALAAAMGVLDDDAEDVGLSGPPSDAMRDVLAESTVLHVCPNGHAVLAVPRELGDQWAASLVEAIKAENVAGVRAMLESAGLMK